MKQKEKEIAAALESLKEHLKPGYTVSGVSLEGTPKYHVARVFAVVPVASESYPNGRLIDITEPVALVLDSGIHRLGIKMDRNRHGSSTSAFRYMVGRLSTELFPYDDNLRSELF